MKHVPENHPLRLWLAGLVQDRFQSGIGICEPALLEYLTDLLTEFIHVERINRLGDGSGRNVEDVAEMLFAVEGITEQQSEEKLREVHRHIGDYTLFWTGVYPENLRRMHRRSARDDLIDFFEQGKRSYDIACRLSSNNSEPAPTVLRQLSDEFEYCVYGLGLVRRGWENEGGGGVWTC